jgi:hypothetical protein
MILAMYHGDAFDSFIPTEEHDPVETDFFVVDGSKIQNNPPPPTLVFS